MNEKGFISPMNTDFKKLVGKKVTVIGRISTVQWQHMIRKPPDTHPNIQYFDLEDSYQIVIYTKEEITTTEKIEITGKVIKLTGNSKRPGSKYDKEFIEYQIIVDEYKILETKS